ncbi:unnamed protein product [Gordionus sp. m RMFG-2023]
MGWTPLMLACYFLQLDIVIFFVNNGCNIGLTSSLPKLNDNIPLHLKYVNLLPSSLISGQTPLILSCLSTQQHMDDKILNIIQTLIPIKNPKFFQDLEPLIDINAKDSSGKTALMYSARLGRTLVVNYLIHYHAAINLQDNEGMTALCHAAHMSCITVLRLLVISNADLDIITNDNKTALEIAFLKQDTAAIEVLGGIGKTINYHNSYISHIESKIDIEQENKIEFNYLDNHSTCNNQNDIEDKNASQIINLNDQSTFIKDSNVLNKKKNENNEINNNSKRFKLSYEDVDHYNSYFIK